MRKIPNKNILKIAEVLEINPDWLLGNSDIMENPITKSILYLQI